MTISVKSCAYINELYLSCIVTAFDASCDSVAFSFIKIIILNHYVYFPWSHISDQSSHCLVDVYVNVEKCVDLLFAAVCAEEENWKKEDNYESYQKVETPVVEVLDLCSHDVDFEVMIAWNIYQFFLMIQDSV